ncbi:MAG: alpha-1,2-fucosyltransferase [Flavobacteriales bacterium]|jgi:hypothetical protein|nr:alpha-1,2-fucosyltransferase [Flavobacteriales bacterium]
MSHTSTIVVRLSGGLGNQLFQYALGRSLYLSGGRRVLYDLDFFERKEGDHIKRSYGLGHFGVECERASSWDIAHARHRGSWIRRTLHAIRPGLAPERPVNDTPDMRFDPAILAIKGSAYLDGYWQSEHYFDRIADQLRSELTRWEPGDARTNEWASIIGSVMAVSLHVRRGDYVSHRAAMEHFVTCDVGYYAAAMEFMQQRIPDIHFFVFSDDHDWARDHLPRSSAISFVDHTGPDTAHHDVRLMSLCRHHIIANSSLSWWGAWLGRTSEQNVVAPRFWFKDPMINAGFQLPPSWTRI